MVCWVSSVMMIIVLSGSVNPLMVWVWSSVRVFGSGRMSLSDCSVVSVVSGSRVGSEGGRVCEIVGVGFWASCSFMDLFAMVIP